jgi:hypothetical protein
MEILIRYTGKRRAQNQPKVDDALNDNGAVPGKRVMAKINKLLVGCKGFVLKKRGGVRQPTKNKKPAQ